MRDATEIVVVLDKSGSMWSIKDDVVGGFNRFLEEQKALPGECRLTMVLFDDEYNLKEALPVRDVLPLDDKTYSPGGSTALLDALGRAVDETGKRLSALEEAQRPNKVVVVVITDGQENASCEYSLATIRDKVEHQQTKYSWKFMFLGAEINSFAEARSIGISSNTTVNFSKTKKGVQCLYAGLTDGMRRYRSCGEMGDDWKDIVNAGNEPDKK